MKRCLSLKAVSFVEAAVGDTVAILRRSHQDIVQDAGLVCPDVVTPNVKPLNPVWCSIDCTTVDIPVELPDGCDKHMVLLAGKSPAILLDQRLYAELKGFAKDFRQLKRLESFFQEDLGSSIKEIKNCDEILKSLHAKKHEMLEVLAEQGPLRSPVYNPGSTDAPRDIGPTKRLDPKHLEKVQKDIDLMRETWQNWYDKSHECRAEMQKLRREIIPAQFELSDMLCSIFQEAGLMGDEKEQWENDRESLRPTPLRYMRWRTVDADLPVRAKEALADDQASRPATNHHQKDDEITAAYNEYEMCHWNRRVAREDFAHRKELIRDCQNEACYKQRLGASAWHDADLTGLREGARLTRNLIDAESAYRSAVDRLRALKESVVTPDSSRFTSISSGSLSMNPPYVRLLKSRTDFDVAVWRACVPSGKAGSVRTPDSMNHQNLAASSDVSIAFHDGFSGKNCWTFDTDGLAMRQRAWEKETHSRDRQQFTKRKRWKIDECSGVSDPGQIMENMKTPGSQRRTKRQNLSGWTRSADFPRGQPPIYHRSENEKKSWASEAMGEAERIAPYLRSKMFKFDS